MKKWLVLAGILAVFGVGGYCVLSYYAVRFIEPRLRKVTGPGLTVGEVSIRTRYLSAKKIRYADPQSGRRLMDIEEIRVYPDPWSFLKGDLRLGELSILRPVFYVFRSPDGSFAGPLPPLGRRKGEQGNVPGEGRREREAVPIVIDRIRVQGGAVDFEDGKYGSPPAKIELGELMLKLDDIRFPQGAPSSPFEMRGKMRGKGKEGEIEAKGWISLQTMDLETLLKVQGLEVKTFEPYYRTRVSAEIESGDLRLETKIVIRQRTIDAPGYLELTDFRIKEGGTIFWVPSQTLVSLLERKDHRIKARFHVKGNLDDPKFDLQENFLTRAGIALAEALGIPIKTVGETVLGGAGTGAQGLGEGLRTLGEIFKKEKKK